MTNDKNFDEDAPKNGQQEGAENADGDSGLGNLPPLSEFDSQGGFDSDDDMLPPLGDFESQDSSLAQGAEKTPVDDDAGGDAASDQAPGEPTDSGELSSLGTPDIDKQPEERPEQQDQAANGFQDLAADSDFSPETPDIGPGPDSTLDTPIFDSAFGGSDSGFGADQGSSATQAMESPMFDDFGGDMEFGSPASATPSPDFSPDTGFGDMDIGGDAAPPVGVVVGAGTGGPSGPSVVQRRSGVSAVWVIVIGLLSLVVGLLASQPLSEYLTFVPGNPLQGEMETKDRQIANLNQQINNYRIMQEREPGVPVDLSPDRVVELQNEILARTQELDAVTGQLESTRATLDTQQRELSAVDRDLRERNDEVVSARELLDELRNETAITQARQRGLIAEVERLTGHVGELEEANARRIATKEALEHNIDRLVIQVKESIPLTPDKYNYDRRLAEVEGLREKAAQARWVTPELQNEYTSMHLQEMNLARANEYFFARVPVTDRFGHRSLTWAECLMRGNSAVYYRTLDGNNIGSFENIGTSDMPTWGFREDLPVGVKTSIEAHIVNARIPDFEGQAQLVAERELAGREGTAWQLIYSSL